MARMREIQYEGFMKCIAVSPDGQLLAVGLWEDGSILLDAHSGEMRLRLAGSGITNNVAFSPASSDSPQPLLLAAGYCDTTARVWDCRSGACVAVLRRHSGPVKCVAFSPDGRLLASVPLDKTVRLWRTDDWHAPPAAVMRCHVGYVESVAFSSDGRLLASCSRDCTVRLWRLIDRDAPAAARATIATAGPALEDGRPVFCVAFSSVDSRLLAYGGSPGFLALARVGAGDGAIAKERELQGHTDIVRCLAFSPCSQELASASNDRTVRLWSVASGACLRVLRGHTSQVTDVAFFPNGKQLASGSTDGTVRIWTLCAWSDQTHHLFGAPLKTAVFALMCVRARLELEQEENGGQHQLLLPRLPMEVWLLIFGQLQLALEATAQAF